MTVRILTLLLSSALLTLACDSPSTTDAESAPTAAAATTVALPVESVVAPQHRPSGDVEFQSALDLHQPGGNAEPQLRKGRVAVSRQWPASLYATFITPRGTASCTAALLGPQVMLTAAHCVPTSGVVKFTYQGHGQPYLTACMQHPRFINNADPSADYALCKIDRPFSAPPGFKYETVSTSPMAGLLQKSVLLTGFGCISDAVSDMRSDGKFRIGFNTIDETSSSPERRRGGDYYSPQENDNLFTKDDPALANLCPGDSGGPAFTTTGGQGQFSSRLIIGVNSRVFYRDAAQTTFGSSLISATGGPDFRAWAEDWARNAGVAACGLNGALTNCRS